MAVVLSVFGGATAWALGVSIPVSVGASAVMLATAAAVGAVTHSPPARRPQSRQGSPQRCLFGLFEGHVRSLRTLRSETLPRVVAGHVDDALAAADAARATVAQLAAAVDAFDEAIAAARRVAGHGEHAKESIAGTVERLTARRAKLVDGLTSAVDEVGTVYAGLLELAATARTIGIALDDIDVGAVNDAVTLMRMAFAELEADAAGLQGGGLR